ncbi:Adenylate and Guanylate cyclase catalytic domain containing protein [Trichomonas vaginalis G3]|uniref:Adenylate and Guanylate cyclase catalytic domain containing protein n=1 Tax=Trichomonas vaginalis (strain ATCC PRA-98 / G3) TaxID=412133 RepID=A2DWV8_TRIV3|nr:guanylate cyclase protein [Trichomonas vaginalis G3]EAY15140.1 Adenylate and Guanylate cyclase catalytic domain containing protein [Trichomonas vaginalis G3]KAI5499168.1 guanylate cyclase protein [Trichomonas vaginalis G3]|eukprot:XP_001327363.1 Adenylate and Guanylate cyclase catalytic domain containing protein [Trichomonas vaginalis G3]
MREEGETSQATTSVLIQHNRYRRILKRRVSKELQDIYFRFFNYVFTMASSTKLIVNIFRYIIIVQILASALQITNASFWGTSTTMSRIFRILSVVVSLDVSSLEHSKYSISVLVVSCVALFSVFILCLTMYFFNKLSKLSNTFVIITSIYVTCIAPYFLNVQALYIGHEIDTLIVNGALTIPIVNIVIDVISSIIFYILHTVFVPSFLNFRPTVYSILFTRDSQIFISGTSITILLSQIGAAQNKTGYQIVGIVALVGDLIAFLVCLKRHAWLSDNLKQFYAGISILNICFRIIIPVVAISGKSGNEILAVCYIVLVLIIADAAPMIEKKFASKLLLQLDQYQGMDFFEEHKYREIAGMFKTGFFSGHPKLHNWTFIDDAFTKYPNDRVLTILYARFAAIYPDEIERVRDCTMKLIAIKKHDVECKKLISDLQSLLQLRERNLTKGLKKQLTKVKEKSDRCISHTRRIWECVIRGSTSEIDSLSVQLQYQSKAVNKDYSQLLLIYPNNPFVARSYSQFMQSVMCDLKQANEYHQIYSSLKVGRQLQTEKGYYFATTEIPTLPTDKEHSAINSESQIPIATGSVKLNGQQSQQSFLVGLSSTSMTEGQDGLGNNNIEISPEMQYVENAIHGIKLPSQTVTRALIVLMFVVVLLATTIPFLIIIPKQLKEEIDSAVCVHTVADMYTTIYQIMIFAMQYTGSTLRYFPTFAQRFQTLTGENTLSFSDSKFLLSQLERLEEHSHEFETALPTMKKTGYYAKSLDMAYNTTAPITLYSDNYADSTKFNGTFSLQSYILYMIKISTQIVDNPEAAINTSNYFSATHNIQTVDAFWKKIMKQLITDSDSMFTNKIGTVQIMLIFDLVFIIILDIVIMIIVSYLVHHEKTMIANAFKAIPKRSISQIVQRLNKALNKNIENDNEKKLDTQEENALRILSTSNTSTFDIKLFGYFMCPQITYIAFSIGIFVVMYRTPLQIKDELRLLTPQFYDLVLAPVALQQTIIDALRYNFIAAPGYLEQHPDSADYNATIAYVKASCIEPFPSLVSHWWFGDGVTTERTAANGGDTYTSLFSTSTCDAETFLTGITGTMTCASIETSAYAVMKSLNDVFESRPSAEDTRISAAMLWSFMRLMNQTVDPGIDILDGLLREKQTELTDKMTTPVIIMIIILFGFGTWAIIGITFVSEATIGTIKLFLQADPHDILNSKTILKILSSDFSSNDDDSRTKDTSFYEMLVSNLLDGTVFMDNSLKILSANKSVENIIGTPANDVIGKKFDEIVKAPSGKEQSLATFLSALSTAMNAMRSPRITMEAEIERNGEPLMVEFNVIAVSLVGEVQTAPTNREGLAMVIIVMKDTTPAMTAKKLLDEEHEKGEHLLNMILPDIIVRKLQRGESNISFSVPSASILFMDIVSFTPWCGSLPAKTVMATLNKMFKLFDTALSRYDKMIKIKCIGDCYMAAGGIFDEVNNPAIHAKQAISFCLDAINGLSLFDIENKVQLRIRAGINCGGPIIAGVLGIEKPTFDILGSAISVAASMEHNGVPMNVHIPQHMYDLVYDQEFVFKERGDIQIKDKMIHTYLVSGYTSKNN